MLGFDPEITILEIAHKDSVNCSLELTPEVEMTIPKVIRMALEEMGRALRVGEELTCAKFSRQINDIPP